MNTDFFMGKRLENVVFGRRKRRWEPNIKMDLNGDLLWGSEVDVAGSGSCPVAGFGTSGVETFRFCYRSVN